MKLQNTDWNHPAGATLVAVEYPDAPIQEFVNWLWTTKQWQENPEMVYRRFQRLREELLRVGPVEGAASERADARDALATLRELLRRHPAARQAIEDELKLMRREVAASNRRAALERARAAKAAKQTETVAG